MNKLAAGLCVVASQSTYALPSHGWDKVHITGQVFLPRPPAALRSLETPAIDPLQIAY